MHTWRPSQSLAADGAGGSGGGGGAVDEGRDDGFTAESASNAEAFVAPPDDTTSSAITDEATAAAEARAAAGEGDGEPVDGENEGEISRSAAAASGDAEATPAKVAKPAKKTAKSPGARTSELKHEIDVLTHAKHKTVGEVREAEQQLAKARLELADIEKKKAGGAAAPAAAVEKPQVDAEPEHPNYRDFNTDEEYESARAKWKTDHAAWDTKRITALRDDITKGVDERLTRRDQTEAVRQAEARMVSVLDEVRKATPDWNERRAVLQGVTSSWYDPTQHGEATTPFLSDLSQSLMLQGNKEGAELLVWLGEDADRTQRLADLFPTRQVRDAILHAPSVKTLLEYFATDEGAEQFDALKQMHPLRVNQAIGALSARLQPAPRGSGAAAHTVTKAQPSARPPAGTPGARGTDAGGTTGKPVPFEDWMANEDEKERKDRLRAAGVSV